MNSQPAGLKSMLDHMDAQDWPDFFAKFREASEGAWEHQELKDNIFGFQPQPETKWLPGLTDGEIQSYEKAMGFKFPELLVLFLKCMNGQDADYVNVYGQSGEAYRSAPGYYSYPRDLTEIKEKIAWIYTENGITPEEVESLKVPHIFPLVAHRFLVIDRCATNPVLSMYGDDIILEADSLPRFLYLDVFEKGHQQKNLPGDFEVKFWYENHGFDSKEDRLKRLTSGKDT